MIKIEPPRTVVDPYLEGIMQRRQQELPLVVVHAPAPLVQPPSHDYTPSRDGAPWTIEKEGKDRGYVYIDGTFTRENLFRFIGELERMAASL